jgi:hypothetical protein
MSSVHAQASRGIGSRDQFLLLFYATKDNRLAACDLAVLAEIIDRWHKETGRGIPTGLAHLIRETGRNRRAVRDAIAKLERLGFIAIAKKGAGRASTSYTPNFEWARETRANVQEEIDRRKLEGVSPTPLEVGVSAPPLGMLEGVYSRPLSRIEGASPPPHTYGDPSVVSRDTT